MEVPNALALFLLLCFALSHNSSAQKRSTYIIHMDKPSMPKAFSSHHFWYSSILNSITQPSKTHPMLLHVYDHAFHGFSVSMSEDELKLLQTLPGFVSAYADDVVTADTTHTPDFLSLNTASGLWPASNYGEDVIIGVVDSGIWPESPSFKDHGLTPVPTRWKGTCSGGEQFNSSLCNKKIIGARYFNRGIIASNPSNPVPNTARDDNGHGSHVSSIAAGNFVDGVSFFGYAPGTARGVAPRARLAVYKALWGRGANGVSSDVLAGIDQAVADGVDILSISISSEKVNLYENPLSIASFGARAKGIVVCLSGGNRGPGIRTVRSGIPWAVVVAAGTVDRWFGGTLTLDNGKTITGWTTFPERANLRNLPLVYDRSLSGCTPKELAEAPENSVVLCNTTFAKAMKGISNSKARAVIVISEDPIIFNLNTFPYPGIVINNAQGQELADYAANSAAPRASIDFQQTFIGKEATTVPTAPTLSVISSRGPGMSYEGILKPDLMAPGVLILAAFNPHVTAATLRRHVNLTSDYNLISGTSMACPHISGVAALLKAAHPDWSPAAIQSAMMTTANPLDNTGQTIKDQNGRVPSPLGVGSGHVDPNRALHPGLVYDASLQDLVDLVCSMNFTGEQRQTIIRSSYDCSNPSSDLNYPSFVALIHAAEIGKTVTRTFRRSVTNVENGAAVYKVRVEVPLNTRVIVEPQTLVFNKKYEKLNYSLTIAYKGDVEIQHRSGAVIWIDQTGKFQVRSPIMVSAAADNFN